MIAGMGGGEARSAAVGTDAGEVARLLPGPRMLLAPRMLLIDTCGVGGSLALAEADGRWVVRAAETMPGRSASERLVPTLRAMLEGVGWNVAELAAVAVVHGPGSFTGLRVGVSAAKGLCEAGGVPLIAISRLAVLAEGARAGGGRVHALLDAGREEVFHGVYRGGVCEREEMVTAAEATEAIAADGDGATAVAFEERVAALVGRERVVLVGEPTAAGALGIAAERWREQAFADAATLDGNYLRRTETEIRQRMEAQARVRRGGSDG